MLKIIVRASEFVSRDSTLLMPDEIHMSVTGVTACHAEHGDIHYDDMSSFAEAYGLDEAAIYASQAWGNLVSVRE